VPNRIPTIKEYEQLNEKMWNLLQENLRKIRELHKTKKGRAILKAARKEMRNAPVAH
jgi:hypothetical protein